MASEGVQLFSAFGKILLDDNGVEDKLKSITKQGENTGTGLNDAFDKIKGAALKLGAALVGGIGLHDVYEEATENQTAMAQMNAVLTSTKDASGMSREGLEELADSQSKVTEYSKATTETTENMLLTFTNIGKDVFPSATKAAEDMATAMGTDSKSAALTLGKALNDPSEGLSRLTKQGVTFTDAQKEQIKAMQAAGDTAGAQKLMLQELEKEFGGSAEAAGKTLPGQLTILKNNLLEVGSGILEKVLPPFQNFVSMIISHMPQIQTTISNVIKVVSPLIGGIIKDIGEIASKLFPNLGGSATDAGSKITSIAKGGLTLVKDTFDWLAQHTELVRNGLIGIGSALLAYKAITGIINGINGAMKVAKAAQEAWGNATKIMTGIQAAFNLVLNLNPIGLIVIAIGLVIGALVLLFNNCKPFHDWVMNAFGQLKKVGKEVGDFFVNMFKDVISFVKNNWKELLLFITNPIAGALALLYKLNPKFREWVDGLGKGIKDGFQSVIKFFEDLPGNALKWGKDMIDGLIKGITNGIGAVGDAVKGVASKIASFLHFSVPDEGPLSDADTYGGDFMNLITTGMGSKLSDAQNMAKKVASSISDGFNSNLTVGNQVLALSTGRSLAAGSLNSSNGTTSSNNSPNQTPAQQGDTYNFDNVTIAANDPTEFIRKLRQLHTVTN